MTEQEWLACKNIDEMLRFAARYTSRRKETLFGAACCRHVDQLLRDYSRSVLCQLEAAADNPLSVATREELINDAMAYADGLSYEMGSPEGCARWLVANAVWSATEWKPLHAADEVARAITTAKIPPEDFDIARPGSPTLEDPGEMACQLLLFRDIVGNPFRTVSLDPAWLTSDVVAIARGIYDDRAFDRMPILADALQDAGCDNDDILNHCRTGSVHARGCWVVDLLLGKV